MNCRNKISLDMGLDDVAQGAFFQARLKDFIFLVNSQEYKPRNGPTLSKLMYRFDPRHKGHGDVDDDDVWSELPRLRNQVSSIAC